MRLRYWIGLFGSPRLWYNRERMRAVSATSGPHLLRHNVIVNEDAGTPSGSHVYYDSGSDDTRVTLDENLAGHAADGIVDSEGNLQGAYLVWLGSRGHQLGSDGPTPTSYRRLFRMKVGG